MSTAPTPANLPERAENLANQLMHGIAALRYAASEMEAKAQGLYAFAKDTTNADLIPRGFDLEDVPDYPDIQVVYDPTDGDGYHCICCRGLDISDAVSSDVEDAAMQAVRDAYEERQNPTPIDYRPGK